MLYCKVASIFFFVADLITRGNPTPSRCRIANRLLDIGYWINPEELKKRRGDHGNSECSRAASRE